MANVISFYNKKNGLLDEGRTVDVDYLGLSKVFDTISRNITTDKLTKYRLHSRTMRRPENCLDEWAQGLWSVAQSPAGG